MKQGIDLSRPVEVSHDVDRSQMPRDLIISVRSQQVRIDVVLHCLAGRSGPGLTLCWVACRRRRVGPIGRICPGGSCLPLGTVR